jgi:4-amino-4-deoxy-L-arabinose transferase-like glycosyltransferase
MLEKISYTKRTLILIAFMAIINIIYNYQFPIHFDETYYWWMSKNLSLSYFDIPTLLPYMIRIFTFFGDEAWQIRLVNIFCLSVTAWYMFLLAKDIYDDKVGFIVVLVTLLLPHMQIGYSVTTTDIPFMLFWVVAIYYAYRVVFYGKKSDFIFLGVMVGLGLLSKYSMVLLPITLLLYASIFRRDLFLHKYLVYTIVLAFVISTPVLLWNIQNDWASIAFRYNFGSSSSYDVSWEALGEYLGAIIFLFTPVYFVFLGGQLFKKRLLPKEIFILFIGFTFLAYFLYKAIFLSMAMNWLIPGVHIIYIFIASRLQKYPKVFVLGLLFSLALSLVAKIPDVLGVPASANLKSKVMGFKESMENFEAKIPEGSTVCADYYSTASLFRYHTKNKNYDVIEPFTKRVSDIDFFWDNYASFEGKSCYALMSSKNINVLKKQCSNVRLLESYKYENSKYIEKREYFLYQCDDLKLLF